MTPANRTLRDYVIVDGSLAFIAAIPVAAVFSHRAFGPIALVMAVIAATRRTHWEKLRSLVARPIMSPRTALALSLAALALWIAVTGLWSPTPGALWLALLSGGAALALLFITSEMLAREARDARMLALTFVASSFLALALLFAEAHTNGYLRLITPPADASPDRFKDITALGRGLAALTPSFFPAVMLLPSVLTSTPNLLRPGAAALFLVALSAALELTIAANTAALLIGTGAALLASARPRAALTAVTGAAVVALVLAPALVLLPADAIADRFAGVLPQSWLQRLFVWRHLAGEALACLPLGCGADYARSLAEARETFVLPGAGEALRLVPLHPHNIFLQVWLELGLPGVILSAIALLAGGRLALNAKLPPPAAIALAGSAAATLTYWSVEASIWQEWRLASIAIAAAGVALAANLSRRPA